MSIWPLSHFEARDIRSQQPYWLLRNGIADAGPRLKSSMDCDVAIVGAGITGALIAEEFRDSGKSVVMIDHRDLALGSTSASTALLQYEIDNDLVDLADKLGLASATLAYQAGVKSLDLLETLARGLDVNVNFERRPSLYLASRRTHVDRLRREFVARGKAGLDVEWLDKRAVESRFGCYRPAGILSAAGAQVDPFRLARALIERCKSAGMQVYAGTTLKELVSSGDRVRLELEGGLHIRASHAIVASGYESLKFLPDDVAKLHSTYALVTDPVSTPHAVDNALLWESARPYVYLRRTPDSRLLIGGQDMPFSDANARDAVLSNKVAKLKAQYKSLFRQDMPPVAYSWAGTFGETADGLPYIGAVPGGNPQVQFALCFGGNGITFSAHAGALLRAAIEKRAHPLQHVFGFSRRSD